MKLKWLIILPLISATQIANAKDKIDEASSESEWTVGVSGGVAIVKCSSDQAFGSLSISKGFGDSYTSIAVSRIDSGTVPGLINNIPASTTEFTLSAGTGFGALNVDGYVSVGKRNFETEAFMRNGRGLNIDSGGDAFGAGLALSYDIALSDQTFVTPIAGIDYNSLDIARVANLPNGDQVAIGNKEDGVTGSFGMALQHLFGKNDGHLVSLLANFASTSNTTSFNPGNAQYPVLRALAQRDEPGQKDSWGEIGGSLSFGLNENLRWDVSVIQTVGFLNSDATSLSTGLRHSF